jgi:hypothetical protein
MSDYQNVLALKVVRKPPDKTWCGSQPIYGSKDMQPLALNRPELGLWKKSVFDWLRAKSLGRARYRGLF